ncbi:MAG TPA: EAL domain-containing protein [Steroidobacteraceae bacterium]|nr:EAL domain-containing protein [Steroidobacteraceae bacterium]
MADSLTDTLPDLVALIRRDGVILEHFGGRAVASLVPAPECAGERLEAVWPEAVATAVKQAVRRAIAQRTAVDISLEHAQAHYELRAVAQGPDRAICVIRAALPTRAGADAAGADELAHFDRRGFLQRFHNSLSQAVIQEKPTALALIYLDGIADIARAVDAKISEQVLSGAVLRLAQELAQGENDRAGWYLGQLNADLLAVVMECADRDAIESYVSRVCASLREPVLMGDAAFHLTPYSGVAMLGSDGISPKSLIDNARSAAAEARRSGSAQIHFFTDSLKLRSLARLDVARELREAIANREFRLRYIGRYDLRTGRLVAQVGYLRWMHRLRGELPPGEFLSMAETTGLATALSRAALQGLRDDFAAMAARLPPDARISFGALRHHLLQDDFVEDIGRLFAEGNLPTERLELRISERTFGSMNPGIYQSLHRLGVQLVVDEVGRGFASLDRLARAPIWGLQLDRAWVTALRSDHVALKVCRAGIGAATALGLTPIATGVDDARQREALLELGCRLGSGDLYRDAGSQFDRLIMRGASQMMP